MRGNVPFMDWSGNGLSKSPLTNMIIFENILFIHRYVIIIAHHDP